MNVLLIEDREEVAENVSLCLNLAWSQVNIIATADGGKGVDLVETESPDMVILDLELPDTDGFKMLEQIRSFSDVPIIILTAKEAEMDKVKALETGADDYITIPFQPIDLIARVKAVLRRAAMPQLAENHPSMFISGNLEINFATHDVFVSGEPVNLTPTEYNLLCNLVRNEGKVSRQTCLPIPVIEKLKSRQPSHIISMKCHISSGCVQYLASSLNDMM